MCFLCVCHVADVPVVVADVDVVAIGFHVDDVMFALGVVAGILMSLSIRCDCC